MVRLAEAVSAVPVFDRWLLYAPLHRASALLSDAALRQLRSGESGPLAQFADTLAMSGDPPPRPRDGQLQPLFLGLVPTRACNLRCAYCAFGASKGPGTTLSAGLAAQAIDWMAGYVKSLGLTTLEVHFFGGEPVIAEDFLDIAVHRARRAAAANGLSPHLELSTNGVCSEERARWIGDYFDAAVVSFDGLPEWQNRCRPHANGKGTFEEVTRTVRILGRSAIELCLRVCVTAGNVASLPEIVKGWCGEFRIDAIDFETLQPNAVSRESGLDAPDPCRFAAAFWEARRIAEEHGVRAVYAAWPAGGELRATFCPVGQDAVIVSPDGRVNACYLEESEWREKGMDLAVGHVDPQSGLVLDHAAIDRARRLGPDAPRCLDCFCRWTCAGGCHVNHSPPGCAAERDAFCEQTRVITAAGLLEMMGHGELARRLTEDQTAARALATSREALS